MHRISTLATTAAAVALLSAASAQAATPVGGALYGGGAKTATGDHAEYTTIRVQKGETPKTLNFYGEWALRCAGGGQDLAYVTAEDVALAKDGSFEGAGTIDAEGTGGSQKGDFTFAGRFTAAHIAKGTARADIKQTLNAGGGARCTTGRFRFTVVDAGQKGADATPKRNAQYYGSTSQTFPALLRLDRKGTGFTFASLEYELPCQGQEQPLFFDERMPGRFIALKGDGSFSGTETFSSATGVAGNPLEITATLKGAFTRKGLTGRWTITGRITDVITGEPVGTCTSEDITFAAARR